jgi:hypothetical protein
MATLRSGNQSAHHRILVHIPEFFHALCLVVHEKVVGPRLPEGPLCAAHGYRKLERVDHTGDCALRRLADKQMNMLRHCNVTANHKVVTAPGAPQGILKQVARCRRAQMLEAVITTEGEEVKITRVFVTDQSSWHWWKAYNKPEWMSKGNRVPRFLRSWVLRKRQAYRAPQPRPDLQKAG